LKSDEEVKDTVKRCLNGLAVVYDEGTQKLVTGYEKCRNIGGDYVEQYYRVCNNGTIS
jgi:hypothetical protein